MTIHDHNTRQRINPHLNPQKTEKISKQLPQKGPSEWIQNVSQELKVYSKLTLFTKHYKIHLLN